MDAISRFEPMWDEDEDDTFSPIAYLTDGSEPQQLLETEETRRVRGEGLERALASLDSRSRRIIEATLVAGKGYRHAA